MKNIDFGIRVEMDEKTGSGHFFRCLALAEELKKRKKSVVFLISDLKKFQYHVKKHFPYFLLKGKTENKKILECNDLMKNINTVIIDLPRKQDDYGEKLKDHNVVIVDDIGKLKIFSNFLINGSLVKKFHNYKSENKNTKFLLGPKYMMIRKEFKNARKKIKINNKSIRKVLITFGGSDEKNITSKILPFLLKKDVKISVILGPSYKHKHDIYKVTKNESRVKLYENPKNLASIFSKQDLVISSSGITIYELASLGIPTIMIPANNAQEQTAKEMKRKGFGVILNSKKINDDNFNQVYSKIEDFRHRKNMYKIGRKNVDGKGIERISTILIKKS